MQCKNKRASTKETHGKTQKTWKASGASVLGRYNTPPLQEDLVPRSRMAPERSRRGRGKTKLLLWQTSETKEPWKLNNTKEMTQRRWANWEHSVVNGNKEHHENLVGWKTWNKSSTNQKNMEPHRYHEIAKEHECQNLDSTPIEKRGKTWLDEKNLKRKHNTPVKWISTKRTRSSQSEMMSEESNIAFPPKEEIEDRSLE